MNVKKEHIRVVLIHLAFWSCFMLFPLGVVIQENGVIPNQMIYRTLAAPVIFYSNFSFFIPKVLLKKKLILYIVISIAFLLLYNFFLAYFVPGSPFQKIEDLINQQANPSDLKAIKYIIPFTFTLSVYLLGGIFKIVLIYFKKERDASALETQKKEMQIQFLRTQLNPHFLFNSLNSIYALVRNKSNDASEAVITLSELMRYMLYEVKDEKVLLKKELNYIKNYISLQCLRLKDSSGVKSNIHGDSSNLFIQPLLLISFIENAFKYGTDYRGKTNIEIKITIKEDSLLFFVKNIKGLKKEITKNSGIGLKNIKQQLNHFYLDNYKLNILDEKQFFTIELFLKLN